MAEKTFYKVRDSLGRFAKFDGRKNQSLWVYSQDKSFKVETRGLNKAKFQNVTKKIDKILEQKTVYSKNIEASKRLFVPVIDDNKISKYQTKFQEAENLGFTRSIYLPFALESNKYMVYASYLEAMKTKFPDHISFYFGIKGYSQDGKEFGVFTYPMQAGFNYRSELQRIIEKFNQLMNSYKIGNFTFQISLRFD